MISSIEISGVHYEVDETTRKYVTKKVGRLEKFLPRHARKSVSAQVKLKQIDQPNGNKYEAEIILQVPEKTLTAKDSTVNMLAAVDIVEMKLTNQLHKYKELHIAHVGRRGMLSRFKRRSA